MQNKRFIFSPLFECREIDIRRFRRVASPFEIGARSHILIEKATHTNVVKLFLIYAKLRCFCEGERFT